MKDTFLPYGKQSISDADVDAVASVLTNPFLTTGPLVERFEDAVSDYVGAADTVVCTSGTAALHLALLAAGIGPASFVIVPTVTFLATANAARLVGAEVVFADVDPGTGLMGPVQLAEAIDRLGPDKPVGAVIPVHLAGQVPDMEAIAEIARPLGASIIEDAAHAIGTTYAARGDNAIKVGACKHSDAACFSFHPVKTITMGEGGAISTRDPAFASRLRSYRNHGMIRAADQFRNTELAFDDGQQSNPWYYEMHEVGLNYRATDLQCALGLSQLSKLDEFVRHRAAIVADYDQRLTALSPIVRPISRTAGCNPGWHLYIALIDFERCGKSRARVMRNLHDRGIGTQVHYIPVHRQPYYAERYGECSLSGADTYYRRALSLPLFSAMTTSDVDRVCSTLTEALKDA